MTFPLILAAALGGAIGSVARYMIGIASGKLFGLGFPWGTLIVNVTGSFVIGLFVALFATRWNPTESMRVFLTVGICGGYTTFSAFALDAWYLVERGQPVTAAAYIAGSVALSIGALIVALQMVRAWG